MVGRSWLTVLPLRRNVYGLPVKWTTSQKAIDPSEGLRPARRTVVNVKRVGSVLPGTIGGDR
jgi:hypothetical protein